MSTPTSDDVRLFLLDRVTDELAALELTPEAVDDSFDLLAEGIIDSLGLVEMLAAVEVQFRVELDLEEFEVEDLGVIGPFSRYVAERAVAQEEGG